MCIIKVTISTTLKHEGLRYYREMNYDNIELKAQLCDDNCACKSLFSTNIAIFGKIKEIMSDEYKSYTVDKVENLIKNNKYIRIQKVLDKQEENHDKYYEIQSIINDEDNDVTTHKHVVNFEEIWENGKFIAQIHIIDELADKLYVTIQSGWDDLNANHYCHIPIQLSIINPTKCKDGIKDYKTYLEFHKIDDGSYKFIDSYNI